MAICDHLLDLKSWKAGNPHPDPGLSYTLATRSGEITLKKYGETLEEVMGKTARFIVPPWSDISVDQWDLLWSGEITLKKYGETLWTAGHKVVDLYHSPSEIEVPCLMVLGENCRQTYTAKVPHTPHLPEAARKLLESYLRLADWNQLHRMVSEWTTLIVYKWLLKLIIIRGQRQDFQLGNLTRNSRMTSQSVYNDIRTDASANYRPAL